MRRFLVDTNVIVDVLSRDPEWFAWSAEALRASADVGPLAINPVIYAELSVGLITRDVSRFRTCFPTVELVAPPALGG